MTSPPMQQPPTHFNGQAFGFTQHPQSHNISGPPTTFNPSVGAQQTATPATPHRSSESNHDRNLKQHTKDAMASNGPESVPSGAVDAIANDAQMSRKRSRSGSAFVHTAPVDKVVQVNDHQRATLLDRYIERDDLYAATLQDQRQKSRQLAQLKDQERIFYQTQGAHIRRENPAAVFGLGYNGYGNGHTDQRPQLQYPQHRKRAGNRRTRELRLPRKLLGQQAECKEELVPVRLDIETEKLRLRDTLTWNLNDRTVPLQQFSEGLIEDLRLPLDQSQMLARQVHQEILEQLTNHYPMVTTTTDPAEPLLPYWAHKNDDIRVMIQLNITVGHITLVDQFEWNVNDRLNSPEEFARQMTIDLCLSGEFTTAIAHSIREQSQLYVKSLYLTNYEFDGRPIDDPDIRDALLPSPMPSAFRPLQMQKDWAPFIFEMNEADLERNELAILREQRAQKRQLNRRGGPALPDLRDHPRTIRSLIVSTVIPGCAETFEATGLVKAKRAASNRGRRARAIIDDSDSDDLDDHSGSETPEPTQVTGTTARTRGMRGAASAAQVAMRNTYRSQTPDSFMAEPRAKKHEREEVVEKPSLIVILKVDAQKLRLWAARRKFGRSGAPPMAGFPTSIVAPPPRVAKVSKAETVSKTSLQTEQTESAVVDVAAAPQTSKEIPKVFEYDSLGRVEASHTPLSDAEKPPVPSWLDDATTALRTRHPRASFTSLMRFMPISISTNEPLSKTDYDISALPPGTPVPSDMSFEHPLRNPANGEIVTSAKDGIRFVWMPRIKCNDCPGKLYNALPDDPEGGFEVHLSRNKRHTENVERRIRAE